MPVTNVQGRLRLRFASDEATDRTVLHVVEQHVPLRVVRSFPMADGGALVHLHNLSGGVLGGDDLEVELVVENRAVAQVTTTGATRLYRARTEAPIANQHTSITVGADGLLEYLPDPVIPFAGARYRQTTRITLADNAGFLGWEVLAPGRTARNECFDYDHLHLALDIVAQQQPILHERFALMPHTRPLAIPGRMGPYRYLASFYCCRPGWPLESWQALESALAELVAERSTRGVCQWGVSTLVAHGLVVRGLSIGGESIARDLIDFWDCAKHALYGRAAIPPRKVP